MTSRSTEDYDRGEKLSHYKQIEGLSAVLIVSHRRRQITVIERSGSGWSQRDVRGGEQASVEAPSFAVAVDEVYDGIELES